VNIKTYQGSCLCGKVRFEITGGINSIVYCHCSECRKAQGSAFATNGAVNADSFHFISGRDELTGYPYTEVQTKYFCKHCGSPVMSTNTTRPGVVRVRLGTIESDITERPSAHIFVTSKASWDHITDDLPQYNSYEPNR
jgi:hypothetical protein